MAKFSIGDKVRVVQPNGSTTKVGDIVEIIGYNERYTYNALDSGGFYWVFDEAHVESIVPLEVTARRQLTKVEYMKFIESTFSEMATLIKAKNSDYTAGSDDPFANFRQSVDYGVEPLSGVMVRVGDKLQRIKSFTKNGKLEVVNEGVEDAFRDLIGYSLIALGMLSERK